MTREELVNMLIEKNNINKVSDEYRKQIYVQRLNAFIKELYDSNKDAAYPLNKVETQVFREKYGVFNNGVGKTQTRIAKELNVSDTRIYQRVGQAHININSYIIDKVKFVELASHSNSKSIFIEELKLSKRAYNCLKRAGFSRIEDVSKLATDQLLKIRNLGQNCAEEIIEEVHNNRYCFADEYAVIDGTVIEPKTLNSTSKTINNEDIIVNKELWIERYVALKAQKEQLMAQIRYIDEEMETIVNGISACESQKTKNKSKKIK